MKIQHLAVIFVIIIVPISLVLSMYISNQIKTINYQGDYNSKLLDATYDGIKAFQLNTANNSYSTISNSKIRDIEAAISTFYASLATNFGSNGYSKETLQQYTPALLFTLYDGYYIYSNNYNTETGNYEYGLKPFIYYSCRYKSGSNYDFVVNYTLDNTITIIGTVNNEYVTKTGHLLNLSDEDKKTYTDLKDIATTNPDSNEYSVANLPENKREILTETLITLDTDETGTYKKPEIASYQYIIYNNQKIYKDNDISSDTAEQRRFFYYTSAYTKEYINSLEMIADLNKHLDSSYNYFYSDSAYKYYLEAIEFTDWVTGPESNLKSIEISNAVDNAGNSITDWASDISNKCVFDISATNDPLKSDSVFNEHRRNVIRKSIETNLVSAIANFNKHTVISYEFATPELGEEEWDKIENNISMVTFLQGMSIGGKVYSNYCVVSNDTNQETVSNDSIYIIDSTGTYHKPGCKTLISKLNSGEVTIKGAYASSDFQRKTVSLTGSDANAGAQLTGTDEGTYAFYYPQVAKEYDSSSNTYVGSSTACYDCIVTLADTYSTDEIISGEVKDKNIDGNVTEKIKITDLKGTNLQKVYLRALARVRYDLYMTNGYFGVN